jgi:DNA-binding transcriptional ArsR family regulator
MSSIESKEDLPVIELYKDTTRREILQYALDELNTDDWVRVGVITDNISVGRESVRKKIGSLVAFGVLDVKDPDVNIPHYRLADTQVVDVIRGWDGYPLGDLFKTTGRQRIARFFLTKARPSESYSMNAISNESGVKNSTVSNHIDTLVDSGLVDAVEGSRGTEYTLNEDSDLNQYLRELNELLYATYQERSA